MRWPAFAAVGITVATSLVARADQRPTNGPAAMTFFVTSQGPGRGGDLGGLSGADAHCQSLATAVGAGQYTWRAYLSAPASASRPAVDARSRIGRGPWTNTRGIRIASNVAELHSRSNGIAYGTALDEKGATVPHERHDMLTGSNLDGTLAQGAPDTTCRGWTSATSGAAMVGHHDKVGGSASWNSAHLVEGCSADAFRPALGEGLFYCFAAR